MSNPSVPSAVPFTLPLLTVPLAIMAMREGGWWLAAVPVYTLLLTSLLDALTGLNRKNPSPHVEEWWLFWHRLITLVWYPLSFALVFGGIWWVVHTDHLTGWEQVALFYGIGMTTGAVGIVFAHELMHQRNNLERWLGDLLMGLALYGHFRSEHLLVHHPWVGTPRDAVTARYNEGFYRFFPRVLVQCLASAWRAERARLARRGFPALSLRNPFWRYAIIQAGYLWLAWELGGWTGLGLFALQAAIAVWYLELVNYVEHYGLVRLHLGEGRYEPVRPHHSWNAAHRVTNWFLINLQRHSDHHYKPDRRYPLLQTYSPDEAPQLPAGYPAMTALAMIPPLWRRVMNPRVRAWRKQFYPEITDWTDYRHMRTPMPARAL